MTISNNTHTTCNHRQKVRRYYRYHSHIYDISRWSFLFGRRTLIQNLPQLPEDASIVEIGCGTGSNLVRLAEKYPESNITGVDISGHMLSRARQKTGSYNIHLHKQAFNKNYRPENPADLIVCSYSITMMGQNLATVINTLRNCLKPGGHIAIVDFHTTPYTWFRKWMERNHVGFNGNTLPLLKSQFSTCKAQRGKAYLGLWDYFWFIGGN